MSIGLGLFLSLFFGSLLGWSQDITKGFDSHYGIICMDGDCPPSVGALMAVDPGGTAPSLSCSVTLIAPDQVLTNSHCVPKNLRTAGADCYSQIQISFPKIEGQAEQESVSCDKIQSIGTANIEENGERAHDWALIQLQRPVQRKFDEPSGRELALGEKIISYPVFYSPFVPIGQIYKVECQIAELGYLYPQTFHSSSALFFAKGCEFLSQVGNSGTGIWNEQGEYVGLIHAMVHQEHQDSTHAVQNGSPLVMGLKSLCLPFVKNRPLACDLDPSVIEFHRATVLYSSLVAFEKSLKHIDSSEAQKSQYLVWDQATIENVGPYLSLLYDYTDLFEARTYFFSQGLMSIASDIAERAATVIKQVPSCVRAQTAATHDEMSVVLFNFKDNTVYPGDKGLYLNLESSRELSVEAKKINLEVEITPVADHQYLVSYQGGAGPFTLSPEEQQKAQTTCVQEKLNKEQACTSGNCEMTSLEVLTPSADCQKIYHKMAFAFYLKNFQFYLPECK